MIPDKASQKLGPSHGGNPQAIAMYQKNRQNVAKQVCVAIHPLFTLF